MIKRISPLASLAGRGNRFSVVEEEPQEEFIEDELQEEEADEFEMAAADLEDDPSPYLDDDPLNEPEIDLTRIAEISNRPRPAVDSEVRSFPAPVTPVEAKKEPEAIAVPEPQAKVVPEPQAKVAPEPMPEAAPEPEAKAEPEPEEKAMQQPEPKPEPEAARETPQPLQLGTPLKPNEPAKRRSSRVKTTLLGFDRSDGRSEDIFESLEVETATEMSKFPTGWLVVIKGPGRGTSISLHAGVHQIGRGDDQAIQLDFGDSGISRSNHAAIAFDDETKAFFLGHGGKANIVRLNGTPVLSTEPLNDGDLIRIGETTLRFVAFCSEEFSWAEGEAD